MQIKVCARDSALSKAQVSEVLDEVQKFHANIFFQNHFIKTYGDLDLKTSLIDIDKTDFFTREVDQTILENLCDISIHSAKDLPNELNEDLEVVALTKGVCSRDCLVLRDGQNLCSLPRGAKIGTSSLRRISMIKSLREDLEVSDIRGDILSRLNQLNLGKFDGVVIANAALTRLKLSVNKVLLEGETVSFQGQLAIIARKNREDLKRIFRPLDSRVKI